MPHEHQRSGVPKVFISSTKEDLKPFRRAARDAALLLGFQPIMMEYFTSDERPPLTLVLRKLEQSDLTVVIVAHRYGWIPEDPLNREAKSYTCLECEHTVKLGKPVLSFFVDDKADWPATHKDQYELSEAVEADVTEEELILVSARVRRNRRQLLEFKKWLGNMTHDTFASADELQAKVTAALSQWKERSIYASEYRPEDPSLYFRLLRDQTSSIDIRGLDPGAGKARRFPIDDLFVPLTTGGVDGPELVEKTHSPLNLSAGSKVLLEDCLRHDRLLIVGEPGSGKSTFLRRVVNSLCELPTFGPDAFQWSNDPEPLDASHAGVTLKGTETVRSSFVRRVIRALTSMKSASTQAVELERSLLAEKQLEEPGQTVKIILPILIRISDLCDHVKKYASQVGRPGPASPAWLFDYLGTKSQELDWGLTKEFFYDKVRGGSAVVFLDGLDEAPSRVEREQISQMFEDAVLTWSNCKFVVSTRPVTNIGKATLTSFHPVTIAPLDHSAVQSFLERWCHALFLGDFKARQLHLFELTKALNSVPEIRRMARNPVMLTALAVVHWNERQIPEQRVALYRSILNWLARAREQRQNREPAERCLRHLQHLALAMLDQKGGRRVQVSKEWAARVLAARFDTTPEQREERGYESAFNFLEQEEIDSGILISRGNNIQFWHLTFLEYLAAREIGGKAEEGQRGVLLRDLNLYKPEWRETLLLLAGVLMEQGPEKVDGLVQTLIDAIGPEPSLSAQARCAGLLGAVMGDLKFFGYRPTDQRYGGIWSAVLAIFEERNVLEVPFNVRLEAAEALGQAGDPRLEQDHWITVPGGEFWIGAQRTDFSQVNFDLAAFPEEQPNRRAVKTFRISKYPVTVWEFNRFVESEGYLDERWWATGAMEATRIAPDDWEEQMLHPNRPVVNVNWFEASAFCMWAGTRLLEEAEWEYAARRSTGRRYPWGKQPPDKTRANYFEDGPKQPTPVGLYPFGATPEDGIMDLTGNVWEWVADTLAPYNSRRSAADRIGGPKVLRGACWENQLQAEGPTFEGLLRAATRGFAQPRERQNRIGFRCAENVSAELRP